MPNPHPTKADRRDAARERARELREAQARREKRNRLLIVVGLIVLIVLVAVAVWAIVGQGNRSAIEQVENVPANTSVEDGGVSFGSDLAAGSTNEGAPVLDVYLDYTCPHCADFEEINSADLRDVAGSGDATVVFHPVAILDNTGDYSGFSGRAVQASAVVADQAPEAYLDFQQAMFALVADATTEPTEEQIVTAAVEAGVPQDVADQIPAGTFDEWVEATTTQFGRDGYTGTPTVLIDGEAFDGWTEPGALAEALREK
ncbi:DsbA family protein [Georgenia sp. TF02-10]|uniref:DsbA family protein n=1 Tax=Georgenia sp. TF02-10 TaxID=2917725 RepID=UPI001FA80E07|nr:thioredoxin domain-containing protein [Georgenia sp. TF02-10]UNX55286.1 DsbA family protein [Georgenia sp. TF02-10]